jgi:hypothetical protein
MVGNMKRNKIIETFSLDKIIEHKQLTAFHEAGHAAGIHLNNKARCLPPISFKIVFKEMSSVTETDIQTYQRHHDDCHARVEGGRLVEALPPLIISGPVGKLLGHPGYGGSIVRWEKDQRKKLEADIVNLLIGPLAEAKYIADTDDELFNHKLVNLEALKNYGGNSDISLANEYLRYLSPDKQRRKEILEELFMEAFGFINSDQNWTAITSLAHYILDSRKNIIRYEEVVSMLDQAVDLFQYQLSCIARHQYWENRQLFNH